MAIIKDQTALAGLLNMSNSAITWWILKGLPHIRKGSKFYFDTQEVAGWLKNESNRKYAHLIAILDKYKG